MRNTWWNEILAAVKNARGATIAQVVLGSAMAAILVALLICPKPWSFRQVDSIMDFVNVYGWWAALFNLVPLGLLALTAKYWTRRLPQLSTLNVQHSTPKGFRPVVLAAMVLCAGTGAMRLNDSLWGDEIYSVGRTILGTHRMQKDGTVQLKELPWSRTLWNYAKPTNHILQSILARLSLTAWRITARPEGLPINEVALRLPGYLAGILSVGALALLLARIGLPWEGALAAWLLALHPWHFRLISEARGYGMVLLFVPLICLLALRSLETSRWKWWTALAAAEFALIYTWPSALLVVAILNFCILIRLPAGLRPGSPMFSVPTMRWMVTQTVAAMVFFQLFLPCVPQVIPYMNGAFGFFSHPFWLKNLGALFLTGSHWSKTLQIETPYVEYMPIAAGHPHLFQFAVAAALILLLLGAIRFFLWNTSSRWLLPVFLLPGPLMYALAAWKDKYLYEWYMAFMLPGLLALVAAGALWPAATIKIPNLRRAGAAAVIVMLCAFALLSQPARHFLLTRPAQPSRESILLTRPSLNPNSEENKNIITLSANQLLDIYDPRGRRAITLEDFAKHMKEADARSIPLFVNNGHMGPVRMKYPDVAQLLEDPAVFECVALLTGYEEMLDRVIYKYRPQGLSKAEFERYRQAAPSTTEADRNGNVLLSY